MQKYDLSVILATYNILCRYDLSGNDIKQLDYTIPYPPSPVMKDMKMYPPYEEVIKTGGRTMFVISPSSRP